jgi:tRNA (adenine57-N1/adenine58-N1)-methyltransferase catalytic subunit
MSFCETNTTINEGDTAVVYISFNQLYPIKVTKGQSHHTKYGSLKHADLIGKKYGTKFQCSKGTVYVLQGSPELWTLCLPHRTQILYTPDISMITLQLELKPGSIVVESGKSNFHSFCFTYPIFAYALALNPIQVQEALLYHMP